MKAANDNSPTASAIRFAVEPRLVPAAKAGRRLHLSLSEFEQKLVALQAAGFPAPCPVIGHFDLEAIDAWIDSMSGLKSAGAVDDFESRLALIG